MEVRWGRVSTFGSPQGADLAAIGKERRRMKTMTCKQLGGPCEFALRGESADDVIKAQDQHLKDAVARGDETHQEALNEMKGRWKRPISGMGWYKKTKKEFAALAEE